MANVEPHDPHFDLNCGVLRNVPGISDPESLTIFERRFSASRSLELLHKPIIGVFDRSHLQAIHKYIFQDVYQWAGEPRAVNISRASAPFASVEFMTGYLDKKLRELAAERLLKGLVADVFAQRAAYYLAEINAVHLFREGNGRVQREFIRELALSAGHRINWAHVTQEQMYSASEASMARGYLDAMVNVVRAAMKMAKLR